MRDLIKRLFHWHKYTTLLIYPPRKNGSNYYGFLLRCDCGYSKLTKLPYAIKEIFEVRGIGEGKDE